MRRNLDNFRDNSVRNEERVFRDSDPASGNPDQGSVQKHPVQRLFIGMGAEKLLLHSLVCGIPLPIPLRLFPHSQL